MADRFNNRIVVYDYLGDHVATIDSFQGPGTEYFGWPEGVTVDAAGNILVADTSNRRVVVFDSGFTYLFQFDLGPVGAPLEKRAYPVQVAIVPGTVVTPPPGGSCGVPGPVAVALTTWGALGALEPGDSVDEMSQALLLDANLCV